ncbi:hypothetical protein V6N13_001112 [Hibiscus sabdariffa]
MLVATNQTTGHQRGRPSDPVIVVDLPHVFILQSSYVPSELQSAQKKRRGVEVPMSGIDPIDVVTVENGVGGVPVPTTVSTGSEGFTPAIPSFKDKLMGDVGIPRDMQYISELDVEVREENVQDLLPVEVLDRMATIPTPMSHYGNDVPGWRWSEKRKLSVGSV